jgi:hypothetical protein
MAKIATKTKKKVSTAKGSGKVVKKATKPVTKKAVAKAPVVRKARAPKEVDPNKYGKFTILDAFTEKYPEMVIIDKAPAAYSKLVGKKYVSRERFITFIESEKAEVAIDKGAKSVLKEMDAAGIIPLDVESI